MRLYFFTKPWIQFTPKIIGNLFITLLIFPLLFLVFLPSYQSLPVQATGESWLTGYSYRRPITIGSTFVSNLDSANFNNFPILISLSGLSDIIKDNGADIRFTASDGSTQLPREIEFYDSGTLVAWVKVPTLFYTEDTTIYMYYGKSDDVEPPANSTYGSQNVWTENYAGVWHLKETGTNPAVFDSTSNANNSTSQTWTPTAGQIDGAGSFNGSSNSINIGSTDSLNTSFITVSGWAKTNAKKWQYIALKNVQWNFGRDNDGKYYVGVWNKSGVAIADEHSVAVGSTGVWEYVAFTFDGASVKYYVNKNLVINKAVSGNLQANTNALNLGSQGGDGNFWNGLIDDVKISNIARSAGWIATEYNNQNSPSTFAVAADQETPPTPTPTATPTLTPTPTPTPTPTVTPTSAPSTSSSPTSSTPSCNDNKPIGIPNLFQIDSTKDTATIYFTPITHISRYYFSYSTNSSAEEHGVEVNLGNEGVQHYTIKSLSPNTQFYFKVRGQNGCMPGDWSTIKAYSTKQINDSFNLISTVIDTVKKAIISEKKLDISSPELNITEPNRGEIASQAGISLNVLVKDNNNNPLEGVDVTLHSKVQTGKTDKKGIVKFTDVEPGEHRVLLSYNEYNGEQKLNVNDKNKEQTLTLQVQMHSSFSLPLVVIIISIMVGIIIFLLFIIFKKRHSKSLS